MIDGNVTDLDARRAQLAQPSDPLAAHLALAVVLVASAPASIEDMMQGLREGMSDRTRARFDAAIRWARQCAEHAARDLLSAPPPG